MYGPRGPPAAWLAAEIGPGISQPIGLGGHRGPERRAPAAGQRVGVLQPVECYLAPQRLGRTRDGRLVLADVLALLNCGMTIAARMPRMITTIRISISVKPLRVRGNGHAFSGLHKHFAADPFAPCETAIAPALTIHIELIWGSGKGRFNMTSM